ncbi:hypothetical protein, partial [Bradyrhizobium sp. 145]|uniref:hypothetical protein n=1 Tax=Bradyrhizobium sp. 145 TaxID=2782621 RepID=UPI001FF752FE
PAPPIARCSHRAKRRNIRRDSNRYWVKLQGQVSRVMDGSWASPYHTTCRSWRFYFFLSLLFLLKHFRTS